MSRIVLLIVLSLLIVSCTSKTKEDKNLIHEDKLGFIDASVESEETNLKNKAKFDDKTPGTGDKIERAFENAPPMIPHTTKGFFPIKVDNNICLSCHLPDKAKEVDAVPLPKSHFSNWRPQLKEKDGIYYFEDEQALVNQDLKQLNNAYFNCSQCHAPQAKVSVNIENRFTPEFRRKFGIEKSYLDSLIKEGIH